MHVDRSTAFGRLCAPSRRPVRTSRRPAHDSARPGPKSGGRGVNVRQRVALAGAIGHSAWVVPRDGRSADVSKSVRSPLGRPRQAHPARLADRQRRERGHARGAPRAAGSGRGARGRARLHREGEGQGRRPERGQVGHARPDGGQDRARRAGGDAGLGCRAHRSRRPAAGRDHDGRPAGLRQDHHHGQDRLPPDHARQEESADGLARHAPAGRAGAAARAGRADRGRHAADRRRPDAAADRPARARCGQARRLRRRAARHRGPHAHRRRADAASRRTCATSRTRTRRCWSPTA